MSNKKSYYYQLSIISDDRHNLMINIWPDDYRKIMEDLAKNVTTITLECHDYRFGEQLTLFTRHIRQIELLKTVETKLEDNINVYDYFNWQSNI